MHFLITQQNWLLKKYIARIIDIKGKKQNLLHLRFCNHVLFDVVQGVQCTLKGYIVRRNQNLDSK